MLVTILAAALTISCQSPGIVDGDTLRCAGERIRLWGVNSVERGQPGYGDASRALARLTTGHVVECRLPPSGQDRDRYGRAVRQCFVGGRDVAAEMVRQGQARDMPRYSKGYYGDVR